MRRSRSGSSRRIADDDEPAVEIDGDAVAFDASGIDAVVFRFAPNAGEPGRPLARIASGGELSRVALAIKEVLAEADLTPTLVFDEIDMGIGGRSARARRPVSCGPWPAVTRSCASRTCPRSRPTPTPISRSPSASATAGP